MNTNSKTISTNNASAQDHAKPAVNLRKKRKPSKPRSFPVFTPQAERIRQLACLILNLHPIDQKVLAKKHGVCPTVISNFRAARRPFPTEKSATFFSDLGLTTDGKYLPEYAFGIKMGTHNEAQAKELLEILFPHGGKFSVIEHLPLSCTSIAITDGAIYVVLHDLRGIQEVQDQLYPAVQWLYNISHSWSQVEPVWVSKAILMTNHLPMIDDVRNIFEDAEEYDPSFMTDPKWEDVKKQTLKMNMTPRQLLDHLKSLPAMSENDHSNW